MKLRPRVWIFLAAVITPIAVYFWPMLSTHPEQDECTFGPVSNQEYRRLLRDARPYYWKALISFSWDRTSNEQLLKQFFQGLTPASASIYQRIASAHAVLRSLGAEYRGTPAGDAYGRGDPFGEAARKGGVVTIQYILDVNKLGLISPFPRDAGISVTVSGPKKSALHDLDPLKQGEVRIKMNTPSIMHGPDPIVTWPPKGACPLVPMTEIADQFETSKQ
jgi:hypothetical protein